MAPRRRGLTDTVRVVRTWVQFLLYASSVLFLEGRVVAFCVAVNDRCAGSGRPVGCLWMGSGSLVALRRANFISESCG